MVQYLVRKVSIMPEYGVFENHGNKGKFFQFARIVQKTSSF